MELLDRIANVAARDADRVAFRDANGRVLTYGSLVHEVARGRSFVARHVNAHRFLVIRGRNDLAMPAALLAALTSGVNTLPVHASATDAEVAALAARLDGAPIVTAAALTEDTAARPLDPGPSRGDLLLASSGSTGVPKIVRRTPDSLDAVAANMVEAIGLTESDCVLAAVPLAHSYGIEHGLLAPLWAGATIELADGLELSHFHRAFTAGVTVLPTVPAALERLADAEMPSLRHVRSIYSAGGALPDAVRDRFAARHGVEVGQLYGSSEVGSVTFRAGFGEGVGAPMRGVSIRILDLEQTGREALPGTIGEVAIRAPSMLDSYVGEPLPLVDGHFLTGDLGRLDKRGHLVLTGRAKLLIDTGGPKVDPLEVERAIDSHPSVIACAVVPIRQSETVCRLKAIVVRRGDVSGEAIRAFARERLAAYKVPRVVEFRDDLPRSATGKILRSRLEEI